jgi:hypothetical protein
VHVAQCMPLILIDVSASDFWPNVPSSGLCWFG